jgi:hypothetical protein
MATNATTAAPNHTTLAGEVSGVVPDGAEKKAVEEPTPVLVREKVPVRLSATLLIAPRRLPPPFPQLLSPRRSRNLKRRPLPSRSFGLWPNPMAILRSGESL